MQLETHGSHIVVLAIKEYPLSCGNRGEAGEFHRTSCSHWSVLSHRD